MNRNRIYRTWSVVTTLKDVEKLAPHRNLEELSVPFMSVYADHYGRDLLGFTFDPVERCFILCLKHKYQAEEVIASWEGIIEYVREALKTGKPL
jgi:hypothetical protein